MERGGERSATAEVEAEVENIFYGQLSNSLSLSLCGMVQHDQVPAVFDVLKR